MARAPWCYTAPARPVPFPPHPDHRFTIPVVLPRAGQDHLMALTRRMQAHFITAQQCDPPTDHMMKFLKSGVYGLDDHNAPVMPGCQMGPYQVTSLVFVASRATRRTPVRKTPAEEAIVPAGLPVPMLNHGDTGNHDPELTYPDFDPATGALTTLTIGRAFSDCGTQAAWRWDHTHFVLTRMPLQLACGGSAPPEDWPTVYRSLPSDGMQ